MDGPCGRRPEHPGFRGRGDRERPGQRAAPERGRYGTAVRRTAQPLRSRGAHIFDLGPHLPPSGRLRRDRGKGSLPLSLGGRDPSNRVDGQGRCPVHPQRRRQHRLDPGLALEAGRDIRCNHAGHTWNTHGPGKGNTGEIGPGRSPGPRARIEIRFARVPRIPADRTPARLPRLDIRGHHRERNRPAGQDALGRHSGWIRESGPSR